MAKEVAALYAKISAETSGFDKAMSGVEGRLKSVGSTLSTGVVAGAAVATAAFAGLAAAAAMYGKSAVDSASNLRETISKTNIVLGDAAQSIMDWSQTSADMLGMSQQQALDAASTFAVFGKSAGISGQELGRFSTDLTGLATDLASFYNTSPEDAITAIGAALRGESEPIRAYGVLLDDATLRQEALRLGITKTTKDALTPQQRVLAATSVMFQQTSDAQGDFARTSDGLAGQQKILTAALADTQARIGTALLPAMTDLVTAANMLVFDVGPYIEEFVSNYIGPALSDMAGQVVEFAGQLQDALSNIAEGADPTTTILDILIPDDLAIAINDTITSIESMINIIISAFNNVQDVIGDVVAAWNKGVIHMIADAQELAGWISKIPFIGSGTTTPAEAAKMSGKSQAEWLASQPIGSTGSVGTIGKPEKPWWEKNINDFAPANGPIKLGRLPVGGTGGTSGSYDPVAQAYRDAATATEDYRKKQADATKGAYSANTAFGQLAGGGLSSVKSKYDSLVSSVKSVIDGAMNLGVVWQGMEGQGGDAINENAKRLADIANIGLAGQSWLPEFQAEAPGTYADLKLLMAEGMSAQGAAQKLMGEFMAGGRGELLDKGMIKEKVKAMILGDQGAQQLAQEIAAELSAELGVAMPEALAAAQSAMGVKGTGATDSTGTGFVDGVDGGAAATGALSKIAKGFLDNEKQVRQSGATVGGWWGEGFMGTVGDNVPVGLLELLVTKLLPGILAAIANKKTATEPQP